MAYNGYLLKIGGSNGTVIPLSYIKEQSYQETPNQRLDRWARRNNKGRLIRKVVSNQPSKIVFQTVPLTNTQLSALMGIIKSHWSSSERKVPIEFYNRENDAYKTESFYMPDITYTIDHIAWNTIYYQSVEFHFIGY